VTRSPIRFEAALYDRDKHEVFIKSSWVRGAREAWEVLASRLRRPETRCLVAHIPGDPDSFLGWCAVDIKAPALIWMYSRHLQGTVRRRGLATSLVLMAGLDLAQPTNCLFWSPAAEAMARNGYRLIYTPSLGRKAAA